eukprot:gnl/TRDRNA2_/TRDRNA2_177599_c1_seq18.p1 gnl/TRDRNA2_/TRDRNA2_177599_c1~~gnl/TRDRNA2_/TRDRNA2_177599_c1_seq18.p1  ORF type:complete len:110 (-),score=6.33 gnl/TRDRNA2_/TRDRNA2_177599_c1_seq18:137-466(-)
MRCGKCPHNVSEVLRLELVHTPRRFARQRREQRGIPRVKGREGPRYDGQGHNMELAHPPLCRPCPSLEQLLIPLLQRGKCSCLIRDLLRIQLHHPTLHHFRRSGEQLLI